MGAHGTQHDDNRLAGLAARGTFTAVAALALVGGGAGMAFADEAPADASQSQAQDQGAQDQGAQTQGAQDQGSQDQGSQDQGSQHKEKGSDEGKGGDHKDGDKGSDQSGKQGGGDLLSGAGALTSLTSVPTAAPAVGGGLPIVSGILG
jgi:hypothetical protein